MARYCFMLVALAVIFSAEPAYCGWEELIIVNEILTNKQASRGDDCPWSIAADDSGNVYTVWEDQWNGDLQIYFRKKSYNGTWNSQEKISNEGSGSQPRYGHPSICVLPGDSPPRLLTCYVRERDGVLPHELRGNTFDGDDWGDPSYYISDDDSDPNYILNPTSFGWATNIVALSDGKAFAFWQYAVGLNVKLYFNEYDDGWTASAETKVYTGDSGSTHYSRFENACVDGDDTIHLVYADKSGSNAYKIYYLNKSTSDSDFGSYPGTQVSGAPADTAAMHPYCAISVVNDTSFLHVVWSTKPQSRVFYRKLNLETDTWSSIIDTIALPSEFSYKPSVACDSYGNIHVVWEQGGYAADPPHNYDYYVVKYRKFDISTGEWDRIATLPADEEEIEKYGLPVIISDVYDNLHVLSMGELNSRIVDEEVFYSFFDAPPHPPQHPTQVFTGRPKDITITWDANHEYDLDGYMIIRRYVEKPDLDTLATVDDTVTTYVDTEIPHPVGESTNYVRYWIEAIDTSGQHSPKSDSLQCAVPNGWEPPKLVADGSIPTHFELSGNYPNPFNASTEIEYALPFNAKVTLEIYDILGRKTVTLIDEYQDAGYKTARWNGRDANGSEVSSGVYIYRLSSAGLAQSKRMILLK